MVTLAEPTTWADTEMRVKRYCDGVLNGSIVSCKLIKLMVQRYLRDLETGHERGLYHDPEAAQIVIDYFRTCLCHYKGDKAGQPIELEDWQVFRMWNVFGWMNNDGTRRFRVSYGEVARKNGKSTEAAGTGLYMLTADNEAGPECYSAATTKKQAKIVLHRTAEKMVEKSPSIKARCGINKTDDTIFYELMDGSYSVLGKDSETQDGLDPHFAALDEFHAHKDRGVYDVIDSAIGARSQPLLWIITTAGFNANGVCHKLRDYAIKVLLPKSQGGIEDDTMFVMIFTLDMKSDFPDLEKDDDWQDERNWPKANPNLGISLKIRDMRRMAKKAAASPGEVNNFLTKRLNVWTTQEVKWLNMEKWAACGESIDETELLGRTCYCGLDLAKTKDIVAYVLEFPMEDGSKIILPRFFCAKESALERERRDKVIYNTWGLEGHITLTPGNIVGYESIAESLTDDMKRFKIEHMVADPYYLAPLKQWWEKEGMPLDNLYEFTQTIKMFAAPTQKFEDLIIDQKLRHPNNPVLNWMASNATVHTDVNDNKRPDKKRSSEKIDGIVAAIMALGVEMSELPKQPSIYETRGLSSV